LKIKERPNFLISLSMWYANIISLFDSGYIESIM